MNSENGLSSSKDYLDAVFNIRLRRIFVVMIQYVFIFSCFLNGKKNVTLTIQLILMIIQRLSIRVC